MITAKAKELNYEFTDGTNKIHLEIENGKFTLWNMWNGDQTLDFCFLSADPDESKSLINLILAATEYAGRIIKYQEAGFPAEIAVKSKIEITSYIDVNTIHPKTLDLRTGPLEHKADGQSEDDCNTPYSDAERGDI